MKKYLILLLALCGGCTSATYQSGETKIVYKNGIFQKQFSELSLNTNGTIMIKGYQSEAASLVKAAADGVATGLGRSLKP